MVSNSYDPSKPFIENKGDIEKHNKMNDNKRDILFKILPIIISSIALMVSSLIFYFQYLHTKHDIQLRYERLEISLDNSPSGNKIVNGILLNEGNRSEIITYSRLIVLLRDTAQILQGVFDASDIVGPFILKPNDPIVFQLTANLDTILCKSINELKARDLYKNKYKYRVDIKFLVEYLNPDGELSIYDSQIYYFNFSNEEFSFNDAVQKKIENKFIKLL